MNDHETDLRAVEYLFIEAEIYTSAAEMDAWIRAPQKILGGETPLAMIEGGRVAEVLAAMQRIIDGVYQ